MNASMTKIETSKGTVYRIQTGSYPNREAAANALERLKAKGVNGAVVGGQ